MLSLNRIRFCGVFSNELNMPDVIMDCAFDSDNSEVNTFLTREAVVSESYDGRNRRISAFKYTESFAPKFTFLKKGFGAFTQEEVRSLLKYLTQTDTTGLLEAYEDDSNAISWASIGNFSEIQLYKIANKRVVGVTATWDSISPFALSDLYTVTKTISNATDNKITINIDTDDNQPVYPRITVQHKGSVISISSNTTLTYLSDMVENTVYFNGTTYYWKTADSTDPVYFHSSTINPNLNTIGVKFVNTHTDAFNKKTVFPPTIVKNNNTTETVTIDGANKIISSNNVNRIFGDDFEDWHWLALYDGKNEIQVEGNCTIEISYREIRKIGEY